MTTAGWHGTYFFVAFFSFRLDGLNARHSSVLDEPSSWPRLLSTMYRCAHTHRFCCLRWEWIGAAAAHCKVTADVESNIQNVCCRPTPPIAQLAPRSMCSSTLFLSVTTNVVCRHVCLRDSTFPTDPIAAVHADHNSLPCNYHSW